MRFTEVPGQAALIEKLIHNARGGRIPHAQMFVGGEGSSALALAIAYAQYALCQRQNDEDACGECPSCKHMENLQHPDVHFAFPVAKSKESSDKPVSEEFLSHWREQITENNHPLYIDWIQRIGIDNKQAQLSVYQASNIAKKLQLKSYSGGKKVLILWMPEKLNTAAANKLLKLIEEPEGDTLILFVTHHLDSVLGTIRSRCQTTTIPPLSNVELQHWLVAKGAPEHLAPIMAMQAEGMPGQGLRIMRHPEMIQADVDRFTQWTRASFQRRVDDMIAWSEESSSLGRERLKSFLHFALGVFEQSITFNYQVHGENPFSVGKTDFKFDRFAPFVSVNNISAIQQHINRAIYEIERNLNPKIVLLDLSFQIARELNVNR